MQRDGFTLDHRTLAALAREVEEGDPIAWGDTALDRDTVYDLIASQIAETFAGYERAGRPRPPAARRARDGGEAHGGELRPPPAPDARAEQVIPVAPTDHRSIGAMLRSSFRPSGPWPARPAPTRKLSCGEFPGAISRSALRGGRGGRGRHHRPPIRARAPRWPRNRGRPSRRRRASGTTGGRPRPEFVDGTNPAASASPQEIGPNAGGAAARSSGHTGHWYKPRHVNDHAQSG